MFLAYATPRGRALIDRRLYLPEGDWASDPSGCAAAGVPDEVEFATKPALARQMIADALDAGVPAAWVTGDEVYGADPGLRADLERRGIGYVLAVGCDRRVHVTDGRALSASTSSPSGSPPASGSSTAAGPGRKGPADY